MTSTSLLLYRDKRLCTNNGQDTKLFATSIRRVIPKIVLAVINEMIYQDTRPNAIKEREEYALRTYLLVHQVAIKLVLKVSFQLLAESMSEIIHIL